MIAILDYGAGNIHSVLNRLYTMGEDAVLTRDVKVLREAAGIILPGVGAFGYAAEALDRSGMAEALLREVKSGKPLFGICLGMQLLLDSSEESIGARGLGLIGGNVTKIKAPGGKVPHMGWTSLDGVSGRLLERTAAQEFYYFVHSFGAHATARENCAATATYFESFDAVVEKGNVMGTQFHPEKSGVAGIKLFENFIKICKE